MSVWPDILSYAVFTGFQFAALCVMTRSGRGWTFRVLALFLLIATDALIEFGGFFAQLPLERWLAVSFALKWSVTSALLFLLSQDSFGRKCFLSIAYGAYAIGFSMIFHLFAYRNVLEVSQTLAVTAGLAVVTILNLVLIFRILPLMPRDGRENRWGTPCLTALLTAASMYVCSFWPVSIITASARDCTACWLMLVGVWVAFPAICRSFRERQQRAAVERKLELMMAEVKARREDVEEARRIRHDQRHHLIAVADLLLCDKTQEALDYLSRVDGCLDARETLTRVWCENETINAILSGYSRKAEMRGIGFAAEAHVGPKAPLSDMELVAVVANLIENAINEVERRGGGGDGGGGEKRSVCVTLRQRGDRFGLTVTNDVPPDFRLSPSGLPCAEPGVGLESVRHLVDRYSGEWVYTLADGRLTCELALCGGRKV